MKEKNKTLKTRCFELPQDEQQLTIHSFIYLGLELRMKNKRMKQKKFKKKKLKALWK